MTNKYSHLPIYQPVEGWVVDYPKFLELADLCEANRWLWDESDPADDKDDLLTKLSEGELHALTNILRIFTMFELDVGNYWIDRIFKVFDRPELKTVSSIITQFEYGIHARSYQRINETLLGSNIDTFYTEYKDIAALKNRISYLTSCLRSEDDLLAFSAFTFTEGASLFSLFGTISHWQSPEYQKDVLKNTVGTITLSSIDEDIHARVNAELVKTIVKENGGWPLGLEDQVYRMVDDILALEEGIIDLVFERGIEKLPKEDMKEFVKYRINYCLELLGLDPKFELKNTTINDWFSVQKGAGTIRLHDFFATGSGTYSNQINKGKIREALNKW